MTDRNKYASVRELITDAVRKDLLGPQSPEEILDESPRSAYIVGVLAPQIGENRTATEFGNQEIDADIPYDEDNYTSGEDDDNEPVTVTHFSLPSSLGISFYMETGLPSICIDVSWGDYARTKELVEDKEGKEKEETVFKRIPMNESIVVDFSDVGRSKEYRLTIDSKVAVHVSRIPLKKGYSLVTVYLVNKRENPADDVEGLIFQPEILVHSESGEKVFLAEHICREVLSADEFYFEQRPVIGRGRGCAASWGDVTDGRTDYVKSEFIPQYEFAGVSPALEGFDDFFFSMRFMSAKSKKAEIIERLTKLADSYENWISKTLIEDSKMASQEFKEKVGDEAIGKCEEALYRIREGISILEKDEISFDAFCFMNRVMILQNSIKNYSKKYGQDIDCSFKDFVDPRIKENDFGWRPFQIAFVLMNLAGIVDPLHSDRELVDLLYFPTGGGKTEAYLGLIAFTIANRRLRANTNDSFEDDYNRDGGVTAFLRYTLRLLTTQQRDRITKMIVAAEMIRRKEYPKYGTEPISIGFWVGGGVTPNSFSELIENPEDPEQTQKARSKKNLIYKQLLNCPFCGKPLKGDDNFYIDTDRKTVEIYCSDPHCIFYKYSDKRMIIPVYLVDEEIYAKCPTVILSTVDKFARLPWDVKTNALFGRVDRKCSRDGFVAIGEAHPKHKKTEHLPTAYIEKIKPFLPPELIIQDELHLITGPLGTVYGAYETIIEDMCSYTSGTKRIIPKYVVSTATIKNAPEQTKCLYARERTAQFPPNGFEIGNSFFIRELDVKTHPFRNYLGICAPGQSMKTALLRIYAIVLQKAYMLSLDEEWKDVIDPYYTLVGYFNSIRELGGAVRLLQDDIPKRINRLRKKYQDDEKRILKRNVEITSRMSSYAIPEKLKQLETDCGSKDCLDTAIATNMIAVGMDVDRLGLMVVTGQPKLNSEYIQATSRIGRAYPGLVITLYNPYRPRDLSHYENFTGYHAQLYRFVEGTTATPFSARARDRVLHALIISAIRLKYPEFAENAAAGEIGSLSEEQIAEIKELILNRLNIIKPAARVDANNEIDQFIDWWKILALQPKQLLYKGPLYRSSNETKNYLMSYYGQLGAKDTEKPTLSSMREVESSANMFYFVEE